MLDVNKVEALYLGIRGESQCRMIQIDMTPWMTAHPNGNCSIWHKRTSASAKEATGATFDPETNIMTWIPSGMNTFEAGYGVAEIRLTENGAIKKSRDIPTLVSPSLIDNNGEILESDWQAYLNDMEARKQGALNAKATAEAWAVGKRNGVDVGSSDETYQNNAKYYAMMAYGAPQAEITAEAWAVGTRHGSAVASDDPTYHNNAKYYAESAQSSAQEVSSNKYEAEAWAVGQRNGQNVPSTDPKYHNNAKYYKEQAASSASSASGSATAAATSKENSEAWAVGKRNGTDVGSSDEAYHNNAKYYKEQAASSASSASGSASAAAGSEENAEAWAAGKRNGTDVESGDDAYHNNAKYYKEQAAGSASSASGSATSAAGSKEDAEAWAVGKRGGTDVTSGDATYQNNSKYYAGQAGTSASSAAASAEAAAISARDANAGAIYEALAKIGIAVVNGQFYIDPVTE